MYILRESSEDEMILEFLKAEFASERFFEELRTGLNEKLNSRKALKMGCEQIFLRKNDEFCF